MIKFYLGWPREKEGHTLPNLEWNRANIKGSTGIKKIIVIRKYYKTLCIHIKQCMWNEKIPFKSQMIKSHSRRKW